MLRRMLTLALLIAFGAPFVAPIFAATPDSQASLPACCRLHGKHHCSMGMGTPSAAPTFQAPPCPFYPTATTQSGVAATSLAAPSRVTVELDRSDAAPSHDTRRTQTFAASAHLTRGPPALLA